MSAAILAVLTPGTMNYAATSRGGVPELTRAEMAGILSGLSAAAMNFALAKYCDDGVAFRLMQFHCIQVASGYAVKHGWKANRGRPCIVSMGCLAVIESINPRLCFACHSPGMAGGDKVCSCHKPRKDIKHVDRARYVDISIRQWQLVWSDRYEYLFDYCRMLDSQVGDMLRKNNIK